MHGLETIIARNNREAAMSAVDHEATDLIRRQEDIVAAAHDLMDALNAAMPQGHDFVSREEYRRERDAAFADHQYVKAIVSRAETRKRNIRTIAEGLQSPTASI